MNTIDNPYSFPPEMMAEVAKYLPSRDMGALKSTCKTVYKRIETGFQNYIDKKTQNLPLPQVTQEILNLQGTGGFLGAYFAEQPKIVTYSPDNVTRRWIEVKLLNEKPTFFESLKQKVWKILANENVKSVLSDLPFTLTGSLIGVAVVTGAYATALAVGAVALACFIGMFAFLNSDIRSEIRVIERLMEKNETGLPVPKKDLVVLVPKDFNEYRPDDFLDKTFYLLQAYDQNGVGHFRLGREVKPAFRVKPLTGEQFFKYYYYKKPQHDFRTDALAGEIGKIFEANRK